MKPALKKALILLFLVFVLFSCLILNSCISGAGGDYGSFDSNHKCTIPKGNECVRVWVDVDMTPDR